MIIFLYGADIFRAKQKIEELKTRFLEKNNGNRFLISTIDSKDMDLADFRNKVLSCGFFSEKKMAVFKNQESEINNQEEFLEIIKKIPDETTLVFWQQNEDSKFLKSKLGKYFLKQKYIFKLDTLSGNLLISWVRERASFYGCEIDNESIRLMCDILGADLWKIDLEINKLCNYASSFDIAKSPEGNMAVPKINRKIIEKLLMRESHENIFKFIDALAAKNKRLALLTLQNEFDAKTGELAIIGMIARQIRILLQIKYLNVGSAIGLPLQKDNVAKELSIHPYVAGKALSQARNFHINELKNMHRALLSIDMSIKFSGASARVLLDRMISKI